MKAVFAGMMAVSLLISLWCVTSAVRTDPNRADINDFNVFHLAGQLIWSGHYADAYASVTMRPLEAALGGGRDVFIPWSYPPAFGFVVAPLAVLAVGPAYLVFALGTLALFWFAMRRLGENRFWPVILATAPALLINIRAGQNGLLTGGLWAAAALSLLRRRPTAAGLAIGGLAVKPHLAPMLPLMLILDRRWSTLAAAAIAALAVSGLSVAAFGPEPLRAFLASAAEVKRFMVAGAYPLHRMTSVYAFLFSIGVPSPIALALHGVVALSIAAATAWTMARAEDVRVKIGLAALASTFISPYFYDYDETVFGVGLMLLGPALLRKASLRHYGLLLLAVAVAQTTGIATGAIGSRASLGGPLLLAVFLDLLHLLRAASPEAVPSLQLARRPSP